MRGKSFGSQKVGKSSYVCTNFYQLIGTEWVCQLTGPTKINGKF